MLLITEHLLIDKKERNTDAEANWQYVHSWAVKNNRLLWLLLLLADNVQYYYYYFVIVVEGNYCFRFGCSVHTIRALLRLKAPPIFRVRDC